MKVSGHLINLDTGLFCLFQSPAAARAHDGSGLPSIQVSLPPPANAQPNGVTVCTVHPEGWLSTPNDAALVRVIRGPAQVLVTIYQSPGQGLQRAPKLQVLQLSSNGQQDGLSRRTAWMVATNAVLKPNAPLEFLEEADVMAHVQRT